MKLDKFGNTVFQENDLLRLLYQNYDLNDYKNLIVESSKEINSLETALEFKFQHYEINHSSIEDFDKEHISKWYMPDEYKTLDIEGYLVNVCPKQNYQRLIDELQEFRSRNMIDLLRWLKYFVDTCRNNSIVWGVGRGSSVASYTLYLLGVHKIDSIKYKLDYQDFLR